MGQVRCVVSMGDPAGIGPEVLARALVALPDLAPSICIYGDRAVLMRAAACHGLAMPALEVRQVGAADDVVPGQPSLISGELQRAYLQAATEHVAGAAAMGGAVALVTAPISKLWMRRAGFVYAGHTDYLAARFAVPDAVMCFAGPGPLVALVTDHIPLAQVPGAITQARIGAVLAQLWQALRRDFGVTHPVIGVLGVNPHAGEAGGLGAEELDVIAPAMQAFARGHAVTLVGPMVPDAAFRQARQLGCHGMVAMYHDQALIPVKLAAFDETVNVTLGLPIIRTSPDHGTAYELAGKGTASPGSMIAALRLAVRMLETRAGAPPVV